MLDKETLQWDDNIFILKEVLNARQVKLSTNSTSIQYEENDGKIVYLNIANRLELRKDEKLEVMINKIVHNYNITTITKLGNSFLISSTNLTKATTFVLPILGFNKEHFCTDLYLENVFISETLGELYLTYRYVKGDVYNKLETFLQSHSLFLRLVDVDSQHVIYVFKIPPSRNTVIYKFINGKYSDFDESYKKEILQFYGYKQNGTTYNILYRGSTRRQQLELELECSIPEYAELYDVPDMDFETHSII